MHRFALGSALVLGASCVDVADDVAPPTTETSTGTSDTSDPSADDDTPTTDTPTTDTPTTGAVESSGTGDSSTSTTDSASTSSSSASETDTSTTTSTGDAATTTDATTATTGSETGCADDCALDCTLALLSGLEGEVLVDHDGVHATTLDAQGRLVLWHAADLVQTWTTEDVAWATLAANRLVYGSGDDIFVRDATTLALLGQIAAPDADADLATDATYVWTADASALRIFEIDGTLRWQEPGDFAGADLVALEQTIHVFAPGEGVGEILRFATQDGAAESATFAGTFGGWFRDSGRFWTTQGQAYRLYDVDATLLLLEIGAPAYGFGDRMILGDAVVDIADPATSLVELAGWMPDGPVLLASLPGAGRALVDLGADPIMPIAVDNADSSSFAFADGHWLVGGASGDAADEQGRELTAGEIDFLGGSIAGRAAVSTSNHLTYVWDVDGACGVVSHPPFARPSRRFAMSGDGQLLMTAENHPQLLFSDELHVYGLPAGDDLASMTVGEATYPGFSIADDGSPWAYRWDDVGAAYHWQIGDYPGLMVLQEGNDIPVPEIAPGGGHVAVIEAFANDYHDAWDVAITYVYDSSDLVAVIDGLAVTFLDDEVLLVSHFSDSFDPDLFFEGSEIVDTDGLVVQPTDLPHVWNAARISATEILATHADGQSIYDAYSAEVLWDAPNGWSAAVAGPDHVLVTDGSDVMLVGWR